MVECEIDQQIQIARKLVQNMPSWKQNILIQSARPTVSVPRTPVNAQASKRRKRAANDSFNKEAIMAETKQFIIEGEMTLAYFINGRDSKHILIRDEDAKTDGSATVSATEPVSERRLESYIAEQLDFPNDVEFNEMFKRLDTLREKGLRPAEGQPDGKREEVRLRVTVEVL